MLSSVKRDAAMLHTGGEYDLRAGASKLLKVIDKLVKLLCGMEIGLNQHGILASDAVTLYYV